MNLHDPFDPQQPQSDEFDTLERELRATLRPVDPPAGFADRVIARAQLEEARKPAQIVHFPAAKSRLWIGSAIAAMLLLAVAGEQGRQYEQRRKTEATQKQFETALQVTDRALDHAREQLQHAGVSVGR